MLASALPVALTGTGEVAASYPTKRTVTQPQFSASLSGLAPTAPGLVGEERKTISQNFNPG